MFSPSLDMVLLTLGLTVICVAASRLLNGTFVTSCSVFWMAWCGFILAVWYSEWQSLIPAVEERAAQLIELGEIGAAAGLLIGTLAAGKLSQQQIAEERRVAPVRHNKLIFCLISLNTLAGILFLFETLRAVGWNIITLLYDVRMHYLDQGLTLFGRISEYLSASSILVVVLLAQRDAQEKIRMLPIVLVILSNAPNGFATGSRGYLVAPIIYYVCAYVLARRWRKKGNGQKQPKGGAPVWKISLAIIVVMGVFTALGEWRWGTTSDRPAYLRTIDTVLGYPAVSITSVYEYSSIYEEAAAHGRLFFAWPTAQLERFGLLSGDVREELGSMREAVYSNYGFAGNNPPTIIADLIGDFGLLFMPVYFGLIMAFTQYVTVRVRTRGVIGHAFSSMMMAASFFTIQDVMFFHSAHCIALIWAVVLTYFGVFKTSDHAAEGILRQVQRSA